MPEWDDAQAARINAALERAAARYRPRAENQPPRYVLRPADPMPEGEPVANPAAEIQIEGMEQAGDMRFEDYLQAVQHDAQMAKLWNVRVPKTKAVPKEESTPVRNYADLKRKYIDAYAKIQTLEMEIRQMKANMLDVGSFVTGVNRVLKRHSDTKFRFKKTISQRALVQQIGELLWQVSKDQDLGEIS